MADTTPLAHFGFVTHFGGGQRATALLVEELTRTAEVRVIDAYGGCRPYLDALAAAAVDVTILDPTAARRTLGGSGAARWWRAGRAAPALARLVRRLRAAVDRDPPAALWVDSEKALFCASRATPDLPLVLYARGELGGASWYCRRDWRRLAGVCAIARATLETLPAECRAVPVRTVVPNIVSMTDLTRRADAPGPLPERGDGLVVLIAATLIPLKAQHVAIEGLARYRARGGRAHLWLAGDVPAGDESGYAGALARCCAAAGVSDAVRFLGWRDDVAALIARADVVALTSETEGAPGILMEAMALAKPVIATRVGGVPELVRDAWNGILIDRGDAAGFAAALARLEDAGVRTAMGRRGERALREDFDPARQARAFAAFVSEAAAQWRERRAGRRAAQVARGGASHDAARRARAAW